MTVDYVDRIALPMEWEYEDTNIYLIRSGSGHWLIDAGEIHENNFERLTEELESFNLSWKDIEGVLVTHLHPDHAGLAFKMLEENPELQLMIPPGPSYEKRTDSRIREWLTRVGIPEEFHDDFVEQILDFPYIDFMKDIKESGNFFDPGETLKIGNYECEVIEAHGHTPNQVVFYLGEDDLLFSGDHVLLNETPNVSLFPEYLDGNPLGDFNDGLKRLLNRDINTVYPGHGHPFHNGQARIRELLEHHSERLRHCKQAISEGAKTALEVAEQIPWSNKSFDALEEVHQFLALGESYSHLVDLHTRDEVDKELRDGNEYFQI